MHQKEEKISTVINVVINIGYKKKELQKCNSFIFRAPPAGLFSNQFYEDTRKLYKVTESLAFFNPDFYRQYSRLHPIR